MRSISGRGRERPARRWINNNSGGGAVPGPHRFIWETIPVGEGEREADEVEEGIWWIRWESSGSAACCDCLTVASCNPWKKWKWPCWLLGLCCIHPLMKHCRLMDSQTCLTTLRKQLWWHSRVGIDVVCQKIQTRVHCQPRSHEIVTKCIAVAFSCTWTQIDSFFLLFLFVSLRAKPMPMEIQLGSIN